MGLLSWVVRILLLLLVVRLVMSAVGGLLQGLRGDRARRPAGQKRPAGRPDAAVPLVKDPECGTFVVPTKALSSSALGVQHYFCSESCRRQFEQRHAGSRSA